MRGQIPGGLGFHRHGAGPHLPDLDHGQFSGPSRQWRDPGGYIGSFLWRAAYLAIGACISATTNNQVIAFVVSVVVCFLFTISGAPLVLDFFRAWAPLVLVNAISSFSLLTHFTAITAGVIDLRDLIFFFSLIALFLFGQYRHRRSEEDGLSAR